MQYDKIALVKVAWSDNGYQGDFVSGNYGYGKDFCESEENNVVSFRGHEAYNFKAYKEMCYAYIPPIRKNKEGEGIPPKPMDPNGWLVIFLSYKSTKLYIVGWYENASFVEYTSREEYKDKSIEFPKDAENENYKYCVKAQKEKVYVPLCPIKCESEEIKLHLKRQILYVKGNESSVNANVLKTIESYLENVICDKLNADNDKPHFVKPRLLKKYIPPETEVKKEIEDNAVAHVRKELEKKGYHVKSVEDDNCGWDLTCISKKNGEEIHVEVKGTSRDDFHFFLSRNEYRAMERSLKKGPEWILVVVRNVLSSPESKYVYANCVKDCFDIEPFCFEGVVKK